MSKLRTSISSAIEVVFTASRWLSDKMFTLLKLFTAVLLIYVLAIVLFNVFADRQKISIKPFAVPSEMEQHNDAAGTFIANIVKTELIQQRAEIDKTIRGTEDDPRGPREQELVSNDKQFLKGQNINLPETAISINDIFEFLSGLFGRRDITGSVFEDGHTLFLQVDVAGEIFTIERALPDDEGESSLHIITIRGMAKEAARNVLIHASDKYRLYYACTEDAFYEVDHITSGKYAHLHKLCEQVNGTLPDVPSAVSADVQQLLRKERSSPSSDIERFILTDLDNKINRQAPLIASRSGEEPSGPSFSQVVQMASKSGSDSESNDPTFEGHSLSSIESGTQPLPADADGDRALEKIQKGLKETELTELAKDCPEGRKLDQASSNNTERQATIDYKQGNLASARSKYIEAIKENCRNPFAWANLGVLASDLRDKSTFNLIEAAVALQRAVELKPRSGWMFNSLCVVDAYSQQEKLEEALNSANCLKARSLSRRAKLGVSCRVEVLVG